MRKYKGCLPCEWCSRWTDTGRGHLSLAEWKKYAEQFGHGKFFYCPRPTCVTARTT